MRERVLFFGILKEMIGKSADLIDLPDGASVRDVLARYESQIPRLKESLPSLALAVNQQYAGPDTPLRPNDEVAMLPPVSGGAAEAARRRHPLLVRETNATQRTGGGRKPLYLDYEAYEEMALEQMESLADQAVHRFQIRDVAIVRRLGRLEIGETSVLIAVASAHRAAAFDACRWLIDTLKRTVPIWKKEYFGDGAVWADGEPFPPEIPRANS